VKRLVVLALALAALGCAGPRPSSGSEGRPADAQPARKRITAAVAGSPFTVSTLLAVGGTGTAVPGTSELEKLVNSGLSVQGARGPLEPRLAEAVPTTDNGLWRVLPDGRMETTWKLRPGIRWHDGTPLTAEDFVFTANTAQDRDLPIARNAVFDQVENVEAIDTLTVVARWKRSYIEADLLFGGSGTLPMPRHLLESALSNKEAFTSLAYWSSEFVGTGPFVLRQWSEGSHVVLQANDAYILGRPRIDEIEVKFIPSTTTLVANVLAGVVDMTMGRGMSLEQGLEIRQQWRDGKVEGAPGSPSSLRPQHTNPNPAILADVQFRRALYRALNRQEMADTLLAGLSSVAHSPLPPGAPQFREVENSVVRYDYDPRAAIQGLEGLGLTRGADGRFRDSANQPLTVEIRRAGDDDLEEKAVLSAADYWSRVGVTGDIVVVPPARQQDLEYRAAFPGVEISSSGASFGDLRNIRRSEIRTADNSYRGRNRTGYANPELEGLLDRFYVTIPEQERNAVLGQIVNHLTDRVIIMYMVWEINPTVIADRLANVTGRQFSAPESWNAHEWDVK
jgi:peptide/nickel transport system substrate-binding protein